MVNKTNTASHIKRERVSTPPPLKPEQRFPVGTKVYVILEGGDEDGQMIEAEVRGYDKSSRLFTVIWDRLDGVIAIEQVSMESISKKRESLAAFAEPVREDVKKAVTTTPIVIVGEPEEEIEDMTGLLEQYAEPAILDGKDAESLKDSIEMFKLASGDHVAIATDKGIKQKTHNEDRGVVIPEANVIAIIDGMGGHGSGDKAADATAKQMVNNPDDIGTAVNHAALNIATESSIGNMSHKAGACFMHTQITEEEGQKYLVPSYMGDVKVVVYTSDGTIKFESEDQSYVQSLVSQSVLTPDEALYNSRRNTVMNALMGTRDKDDIKTVPGYKGKGIPLDTGDRVVIASDGIWDNLTPEELWEEIAGKKSIEAIQQVSDVTDKRMQNYTNIIEETNKRGGRNGTMAFYSDGYRSSPKPDNRAIAIIDIK